MVRSFKIALGVTAVALSCGAAQLAIGEDLGAQPAQSVAASVNRASKSDRVARSPIAGSVVSTISIRSTNMADTSIVVRLPMRAAVEKSKVPFVTARKTTVACEPVVSVLTDVAKHLAPGRCVT